MAVTATVFTTLACLLHVFIFYMESLAWAGPRARTAFGMTAEQARNTRELAFNQGFYNLFLAVQAGVGALSFLLGHRGIGAALIFAGAGSMLAAAAVLFVSSPGKRGAASKQDFFPAMAIAFLTASLLT